MADASPSSATPTATHRGCWVTEEGRRRVPRPPLRCIAHEQAHDGSADRERQHRAALVRGLRLHVGSRKLSGLASGLGSSLERTSEGEWVAETAEGRVTIRFSASNRFGVFTVIPAPGVEIYVPLRVVANGDAGSEVLLTLFRQPGMSDEKFAADAEWVLRDLQKLKALLEA